MEKTMVFDDTAAWLVAFRIAPQERLTDFLSGKDKIFPYFQDSGASVLWYILPKNGQPDPYSDIPRLDMALLPWFKQQVQQPMVLERWNISTGQAGQGIDLITVLHTPLTASWLLQNWSAVGSWAEWHTRPTSQDLYVDIMRTLRRYNQTKYPGHLEETREESTLLMERNRYRDNEAVALKALDAAQLELDTLKNDLSDYKHTAEQLGAELTTIRTCVEALTTALQTSVDLIEVLYNRKGSLKTDLIRSLLGRH
jgi:hypothetical protein